MRKILLKIYLSILKYLGVDILDISIYEGMPKIKEIKRYLFLDSDISEYEKCISDISEIKWHGYRYDISVYATTDDNIKKILH